MSAPTRPPRFIYITGCDGTGKSTQARLLTEQLRLLGVKARPLWLRFPFFFSLPLLAYARLRGLSWYEEAGGAVRHGYWDFRRSWLMKTVFPWLLLLDAALAALWKVYLPLWAGRTLVCERFVLDMLVDLALAVGDDRFYARLPGKLFPRLLPAKARTLALDLDPPAIRARRPDLASDRLLPQRLAAFRALAAGCGLPLISSRPPVEQVNAQIWQRLQAGPPAAAKEPHYGKFRSPLLRSILKRPAAALALHWVFQGLVYMDPAERWFKLALDALLTALLAPLLGLFLRPVPALLLSFLAAHTLNFLFNGQLWGALKQYGLVYTSPQIFEGYLSGLRRRASREPSIRHLYVYGSLAREEWSPFSDLDARLVRRPGFFNGLSACWFVLKERSRALFARFPLDLYVIDRVGNLKKLRPDETAVDIMEMELISSVISSASQPDH